ncbi:MAG: hypothetical protein ACI9O1_001147 [Candidatus Thalassarchaeaceae archaeon]|jgi:hypothetical protein
MSSGGLLQKALEQQEIEQGDNAVVPLVGEIHINAEKISKNESISFSKIALVLGIGGLLPVIVVMWFGIYLIPDSFPVNVIIPLVSVISLIGVWAFLGIGLPNNFGGSGINVVPALIVGASYLSMIIFPVLLGSLLVGDISIGDVEISDDGTGLEVKIRQNGGSSSAVAADVEIGTWSQTMQLKIDKSDGFGDYGKLLLTISDFYDGNALPFSDYILKISVEGKIMSTILDANHLSRTITDVQSQTNGIMSENSDDCGSYDNCVIGVSLTAWSGLQSNNRPVSLPLSNYNLSATLYFEDGNVAIDYPDVTVTGSPSEPFAEASWDSNSGEFGSGSYVVGDYGSELPLEGSINHPDFGEFKYIPKDQWGETDHGCYYFVVEVTQDNAWTNEQIISHTSYYNYAEEVAPGDGGGSSESWSLSSDPC